MVFLSLLMLALLGAIFRLALSVRDLRSRLHVLERRLAERPALPATHPPDSPLAGVRVEVAIRQDHPLSPFETLLKEALAKEGAVVEEKGDVRISGTLKGNGYADVYFDADLVAEADGQKVFKLLEWPPHGDRPENLAREVVARLRAEWAKRERHRAVRELGS